MVAHPEEVFLCCCRNREHRVLGKDRDCLLLQEVHEASVLLVGVDAFEKRRGVGQNNVGSVADHLGPSGLRGQSRPHATDAPEDIAVRLAREFEIRCHASRIKSRDNRITQNCADLVVGDIMVEAVVRPVGRADSESLVASWVELRHSDILRALCGFLLGVAGFPRYDGGGLAVVGAGVHLEPDERHHRSETGHRRGGSDGRGRAVDCKGIEASSTKVDTLREFRVKLVLVVPVTCPKTKSLSFEVASPEPL